MLESTWNMLAERACSSSMVISSEVAHAVVLLKSYVPDLDLELFRKDYPFGDDEEQERDALINTVYDPTQFFMSHYDFSVANDQEDKGSPGIQP
jgi:hypothetical protein